MPTLWFCLLKKTDKLQTTNVTTHFHQFQTLEFYILWTAVKDYQVAQCYYSSGAVLFRAVFRSDFSLHWDFFKPFFFPFKSFLSDNHLFLPLHLWYHSRAYYHFSALRSLEHCQTSGGASPSCCLLSSSHAPPFHSWRSAHGKWRNQLSTLCCTWNTQTPMNNNNINYYL